MSGRSTTPSASKTGR